MKLRKIIFLCLFFFSVISYAKVYQTQIFDNNIRTVQLFPSGKPLLMPIIGLNSGETLELHFDDLSMNNHAFYYTVVQCHTDWTPTILNPMEYINGFIESTIFDYDYSNSTKQEYIHYKMEFPNNDMNITKSGNYALLVYTDNMQNPVFTYRFMVVESLVSIDAKVAYPRNYYDREKYQDITFSINNNNFTINNPQAEIKATVLQNNRWDNSIENVPPYMVGFKSINYDYSNKFLFPSGREFRQFDLRSLRFKGQGIRYLDVAKNENQVYLSFDQVMMNQKYNFFQDLNGGYYIHTFDYPNYLTESDYSWVQFYLDYKQPLALGKVYVVGAFNNWICDANSQMHYSENEAAYTANIFLKQGFYNYAYVYEDENGNKDFFQMEGYYYNTENDYTILVYYTPLGERYDRLIAVRSINSIRNR